MSELDRRTEVTLRSLENYERSWHLFKAALYVITATILIIVFTAEITSVTKSIKKDNETTRALICQISGQAELRVSGCPR